ncbi:MAG: cation diffusion facilitator family transporter [Anaerolineae bacterium]
MDIQQRDRRTQLAVLLGLVANTLLAALKTSVGIIGHSPALLADGVNSTVDVAYYVVVGVFMRLASKPPDEDHPYGHRQFESVAGVAIGAFVMTTGITILWNALDTIFDLISGVAEFSGAALIAVYIALGTVLIKLGLVWVTRRLARQTHSATIMALAYDHRNDIFSALAATVGIVLGRMGYPWVDPLAGALVALVILRTGIDIIREASRELLTPDPGSDLVREIHDLLDAVPGVGRVEELLIHRFGPYLTVNVTIGVDGDLSVKEGDRIASAVEQALEENVAYMRRVHVHYHPVRSRAARPVNTPMPVNADIRPDLA